MMYHLVIKNIHLTQALEFVRQAGSHESISAPPNIPANSSATIVMRLRTNPKNPATPGAGFGDGELYYKRQDQPDKLRMYKFIMMRTTHRLVVQRQLTAAAGGMPLMFQNHHATVAPGFGALSLALPVAAAMHIAPVANRIAHGGIIRMTLSV